MSEDAGLGTPVDVGLERPSTLRDGTTVWVRPVRPADRDGLIDLVEHVSVDALELRYFAATRPETAVAAMLRPSPYEDRISLLAIGGADGGSRVLAQAEVVVDPTDPSTAEAAFLVREAFHGQGLGTILLGELARIARARGVRRFVAYVQATNEPMLDLFRHSGLAVVVSGHGSVLRVDLALPAPPAYAPLLEAERLLAA